jgi:hypothetical protein
VSRRISASVALLLCSCATSAAAPPPPGGDLVSQARRGLDAIRGDALAAHIRFLSDDLLEGRGSGTRGHAIAARYVASVFAGLGLQPAGEAGSFFQNVPLRAATLDRAASSLKLDGAPLVLDEDIVLPASTIREEIDLEGALVHVGYATSDAELGQDLRGKIALVLWGAPEGLGRGPFGVTARAVASDTVEKTKRLAARGAVAALFVFTPELEAFRPWKAMVAGNRFERVDTIDAAGTPTSGFAIPTATISRAAAARAVGGAARYDELHAAARAGRGRPVALGSRARLTVRSRHRAFSSENVAALLPGGDPALAAEVVALSAHLDGLGVGEPVNGDAIYNGALDNATGTAAILEMARAFRALPAPPPRSILFLAVTAEEKGLVGSHHFAANPTLPMARIVANVNIDGLFPLFPPGSIVARGMEHSTLEAHVREAAGALGVPVEDDPIPEAVIFIRSDQYNFVKRGVPAIFPSVGNAGTEEQRAARRRWFGERYHRPSDEWTPEIRVDWMEREARTYFLVAYAIARAADRPRWKPESPFAGRR